MTHYSCLVALFVSISQDCFVVDIGLFVVVILFYFSSSWVVVLFFSCFVVVVVVVAFVLFCSFVVVDVVCLLPHDLFVYLISNDCRQAERRRGR